MWQYDKKKTTLPIQMLRKRNRKDCPGDTDTLD